MDAKKDAEKRQNSNKIKSGNSQNKYKPKQKSKIIKTLKINKNLTNSTTNETEDKIINDKKRISENEEIMVPQWQRREVHTESLAFKNMKQSKIQNFFTKMNNLPKAGEVK